MRWLIQLVILVGSVFLVTRSTADASFPHCKNLLIGQYLCDEPQVDSVTQRAKGCARYAINGKAVSLVKVTCHLAPGVTCTGLCDEKADSNCSSEFKKDVPCEITNGHKFENALLLSIFLGMFGIDRFYLGYPAIGLLKFCTLGFMFLGQLVDILLIAMQIVGPADGSAYVIDYYGAKLTRISRDNSTIIF
ncbi:TM2 domain-containing protein biscotti-like [Tubulanus polymorphus]|uniref:TM2 domain-containing protein biscotti-like n=1 Tax=Tubulanus polymorphus TaxID=672921 RepID=UPI003DA246D7